MPDKSKNIVPNTVKALSPESYILDYIQLINHRSSASDPIDIQSIVTEFSITESIYSPGLVFTCSIKDSTNLIENYQLNGQEIIRVSMQREEPDGSYYSTKLDFYVTDYPLYAKVDQITQVFKITGVSPHVFTSDLKKISRAIKSKTTAEEIKKIISEDLMTDVVLNGDATSMMTGIIPRMNPLKAADWLLGKTYDSKFSPFFLYQVLNNGTVFLSSYQNLISAGVYNIYEDKKLHISEASREDSKVESLYYEKKNKILSMNSNYGVSKIFPAVSGAYASETVLVDLGTKKLTKSKFAYKTPSVSLNGKPSLKTDLAYSFSRSESKTLPEASDSFQVFLNTNSLSPQSYSMLDSGLKTATRRSNLENMEYMTHELVLYGDFNLRSGSVIELRIVKSADARVIRNSKIDSGQSPIYDSVLSGKYIVTGIQHDFGSEYYCKVRVKKDTPIFELK